MADGHTDQEFEVNELNDSDDDLVSYGVFVKEGPEDIQDDQDDAPLADVDILTEEELPPTQNLSDELSEEEEKLLGDLELDEMSLESDLKDFDLDSFQEDTNLSFEDGKQEIYSGMEDEPSVPGEIGTEMEIDDVALSSLPDSSSDPAMDIGPDDEPATDIGIDQFDTSDDDDDDDDELDLRLDQFEPSAGNSDDGVSEETDQFDPGEEENSFSQEEETPEQSEVLQEVSLDDFMEETLPDPPQGETPQEEGEDDFSLPQTEDIDVTDDSLTTDTPVVSINDLPDTAYSEELAELHTSSSTGQTSDAALQGIEQELDSIKSELTELRQELQNLRKADTPSSIPPDTESSDIPSMEETLSESEPLENTDSSADSDTGFFSGDDEDETIALTGDELDNILDTADFVDEDPEKTAETDNQGTDPFNDPIEDMANLDMEAELSDIADLQDEEDDIDTKDEQMTPSEFSDTDDTPDEIDLAEDNTDLTEVASLEDPASALDTTSTKEPSTNLSTQELKQELKEVLSYMDSLLENLPEEKIEEFAKSEHFATYQKLFEELGL